MSDPRKLKREKKELRERMQGVRDAIPPEERQRLAGEICDRLIALPILGRAKTVTAFLAFGSEVPTDGLIERFEELGMRVGVPIVKGSEIRMAPYRLGDPLVEGAFGIREPRTAETIEPREVDAVLTPGLAFDRNGFRLGYGGGFYDRFFRRLHADAVRIGIAFDAQLVDEVPHGSGDRPVHAVVTDQRTVAAAPPEGP